MILYLREVISFILRGSIYKKFQSLDYLFIFEIDKYVQLEFIKCLLNFDCKK